MGGCFWIFKALLVGVILIVVFFWFLTQLTVVFTATGG